MWSKLSVSVPDSSPTETSCVNRLLNRWGIFFMLEDRNWPEETSLSMVCSTWCMVFERTWLCMANRLGSKGTPDSVMMPRYLKSVMRSFEVIQANFGRWVDQGC